MSWMVFRTLLGIIGTLEPDPTPPFMFFCNEEGEGHTPAVFFFSFLCESYKREKTKTVTTIKISIYIGALYIFKFKVKLFLVSHLGRAFVRVIQKYLKYM